MRLYMDTVVIGPHWQPLVRPGLRVADTLGLGAVSIGLCNHGLWF